MENGYGYNLSSQSGRLWLLPTLSVCVSVCLCFCPAFTAYISVTMGWILIKLGENVGTYIQVRLIVLKFEHSAAKGNTTHKGKFFNAFLCVSEQFESIETHLFF